MKSFLLVLISLVFLAGCSVEPVRPVVVNKQQKNVSFSKDVQPILDKRCVVCHSCYNSPCQAKLSSFAGIDRGASKIEVYNATRLRAQEPTRLFIDANSTKQWRAKEFFSLTANLTPTDSIQNDSILLHLLNDKQKHPEVIGNYDPEHDRLTCPRDKMELSEYLDEKPNHGMPYGFPALEEKEYITLASWLMQGAKSDHKTTISKSAQKEIQKWESFLNTPAPKHTLTARYLYEHLYLAHIYFPSAQGEFFELVRSYTPSPHSIAVIPTARPFDDPKVEKFYYRLRKIESTIVHKTHIVLQLDDAALARYKELFIQSEWRETPYSVGYDPKVSANPFLAYKQIPTAARYQFLLDNSEFIIRTFIRGPVCRGQMAVNVIHDHFWVMFRDPAYDIAVVDPEFIDTQTYNLSLPIENINNSLYKVFSDEYRERYYEYYLAKKRKTAQIFKNGYPLESIYKGRKSSDSPILTIYRHFDSASVSRGVLGEEPRTMWVIDYTQFERLYYTLVAGFDVFGNVSHQTNIRRYMDFLRLEGESNFLEYMPPNQRLSILNSWYLNDGSFIEDLQLSLFDTIPTPIEYMSTNYKEEFIKKVVSEYLPKELGIHFDKLNFITSKLTLPENGFVRYMTDSGANNMFFRLELPDGKFITKSFVINRWHDNVDALFTESSTLEPTKDTMDILDKFIGSYPNVFIVVKYADLKEFLELMKNMDGDEEDFKRLTRFFISRSDPKFWEYYDWFQNEFNKQNGVEAGLLDLNRYARQPW